MNSLLITQLIFSHCNDTDILNASLQNLDRLGIIKIRYDQVVKPDERYNVFYEDSVYKDLAASFGGKENTDITFSKGLIELTEFGKAFCQSCCEN